MSAAPTSRCAARSPAPSSTTATPTASTTPVTRRSRAGRSSLYRDDGDKVLEDADDGGPARTPRRPTDDDGVERLLLFQNLPNGDYIVCEGQAAAGWNQSLPNAGTSDKADCAHRPATPLAPVGRAFTMGGADHDGNDFGNYQNATKSGTKFDDMNGDGDRDAGEPGWPACQIHLFGTNGARQRGPRAHHHRCQRRLLVLGPARQLHGLRDGACRYTQSFPTSGPSCDGHEDASADAATRSR